MVNVNKVKIGKKSRSDGKKFETLVRKDLQDKGWIVDKWSNNVEFVNASLQQNYETINNKIGKIIPAKSQYNPFFKRIVGEGSGFPDFMAFKHEIDKTFPDETIMCYEVIAIESKINGKLDKAEREKCKWYLDNKVFSKILIARKENKNITYETYKEKEIISQIKKANERGCKK